MSRGRRLAKLGCQRDRAGRQIWPRRIYHQDFLLKRAPVALQITSPRLWPKDRDVNHCGRLKAAFARRQIKNVSGGCDI